MQTSKELKKPSRMGGATVVVKTKSVYGYKVAPR
jgi:hypothetical protein